VVQVQYAAPQELPEPVELPRPGGGPVPPAAPARLSVNEAIAATLMADPKIPAGLEAIHQAHADWLTASLPPNPTLIAQGQYLPLQPFTPATPGGPTEFDLQVAYPVDWFLFGKRASAMTSACLGVRQSETDYADLVRQRVTATATAFYDVVEAKGLLRLARDDTDNLARLEAATRRAVDAGGRPVVDWSRVRLDLLTSQQNLREAESTLAVNKAKLRAQMGRIDRDADFDVDGNLDAPLTAQPLPAEEAFALAQQNRPDIQSLRTQVSKAEADVVVERRKAFPQVTPQFGYTRQDQAQQGFPDANAWYAQLTATVPLFDRNQGNRAKAQSVATQDSYNLQSGLVDLRAEIEEAVQDLSTAYKKATSVAGEQVKLAAEVRDAIVKAYNAGGRPLIDVLDAERTYRDTYRLYISSRADYWRAVYKYNSAIGKQITQ
jgi:cobalt-zinc-cadmium efflux system outer membrane protein